MVLSWRNLVWSAFAALPLAAASVFAGGAAQSGTRLGFPVSGLSAEEELQFWGAAQLFRHNETKQRGLGPVFNGTSCFECHEAGAAGGASEELRVSRVTRIGGTVNGQYADLAEVGGPLIQARSLAEKVKGYPVKPEKVPPQAQFVSKRITTPLFGTGLIDAIPSQSILDLAAIPRPDGIQGVPNLVLNPETGRIEVGRFGWKAQVSALHWFSAQAYLDELGITSPGFQQENLPQGQPIPPGADTVLDPENIGSEVDGVTFFMRFLAPPSPVTIVNMNGQALFQSVGCANCHVSSMRTSLDAHEALADREVPLYSDLLLHRMGSGLADGIRQGLAGGDQFRTAPLWGVRYRPFLLHDGRARSVDQAIRAHGGEASATRLRYLRQSAHDRNDLLRFVQGL